MVDFFESCARRWSFALAFIYRADLHRADMTKAILKGVNLTKANLTEARLREVDLSEVRLSGSIRCHTIMPDGAEDLSGCR